jgi:hypothetical protein
MRRYTQPPPAHVELRRRRLRRSAVVLRDRARGGVEMTRSSPRWWKSNIPVNGPARASNELSPMRPVRQLCSMNRRIELWCGFEVEA